jgi:hypothetical protein
MTITNRLPPNALRLALASWAVSWLAGAQSIQLPASGRFVLPVSQGNRLLGQCSRPAPRHGNQFWQPSADQINELEIALQKYLETRESAGQPIPPKDLAFHRQYIGFIRRVGSGLEEALFIYGNFYPERAASPRAKKFDESAVPVAVCDGGDAFWGIIYRPSTHTIEEIRFNGSA